MCVFGHKQTQIKYVMLEKGRDQGECRAGAGGSRVLLCIRPFRSVWLRGASGQSLESNKAGSSPAGRGAVQRPWGRQGYWYFQDTGNGPLGLKQNERAWDVEGHSLGWRMWEDWA